MKPKLPLLNAGLKDNTSLLAIKILCGEWPLSATALHKRISERHSYDVSYQRVHNALQKLAWEGILEKDNKRYYKLNVRWLAELRDFGSAMRISYLRKKNKLEFPV